MRSAPTARPEAGRARPGLPGRRLLLGVAGAFFVATGAMSATAGWSSGHHVSGAWTGLAVDLAHGTFYRPLYSEALGYGGTRFMPLHIVAHAAWIRAGGDPITGGHVVAALAALLLVGATALWLRGLGLGPVAALAYSALPLVSGTAIEGLSQIRGDLLAAALVVLSLALVQARPRGENVLAVASVLTLAFAAKLTAAAAVAPAAAFLWVEGRRRQALALAGSTVSGYGLVVAGTQLASGGRFLAVLQSCASGGTTWAYERLAPFLFLDAMRFHDRATLVLIGLASVAAVLWLKSRRGLAPSADPLLLPVLWWSCAMLVTLVIFASPGTVSNHLVDVQVASVVLVASVARHVRAAKVLAAGALVAGVCFGALVWLDPPRDEGVRDRALLRAAIPPAGAGEGPIVSENPLIPIALGETPYVLDPFMLRLLQERLPRFEEPLLEGIRRGTFRAVILQNDVESPEFARWYRTVHFGPAFVDELRSHYEVRTRVGRYWVLVPRRRGITSRRDGP
jgi:hypothetical protein